MKILKWMWIILALVVITLIFLKDIYAEDSIKDYGYYENKNEISAKNRFIPYIDNIFDFENSKNPYGEKIEEGKFYIETKYKGGYNGTDADYIYLDEIMNAHKPQIDNNSDEILKVEKESIKRDNKINDEILTNKDNIKINTKEIKTVDLNQTNWNKKQDNTLNDHDTRITNNNNRINDLDDRVSELEETQQIIGGEIRLYDSKKWQVKAFADYSTNRNTFDRVGVKMQFKFGKSYEETRIEELEKKLDLLLTK